MISPVELVTLLRKPTKVRAVALENYIDDNLREGKLVMPQALGWNQEDIDAVLKRFRSVGWVITSAGKSWLFSAEDIDSEDPRKLKWRFGEPEKIRSLVSPTTFYRCYAKAGPCRVQGEGATPEEALRDARKKAEAVT
jgi:hypothetical protein